MSDVITIEKDKVETRKELRKNALLRLYNFYFEKNGSSTRVAFEDTEEGVEDKLAYFYLADLGLITVRGQGLKFDAKITAHGINRVESEIE
ncbi:hypothetical protein MKX57_09325 [Lysinibacillus sp. FSL M8-0216]|uniref:hypothetical protein n=1 Tax=Lysinibacillus sp. FSL M8-0216 TaxID=2921619 RepID=UPI00315B2D66